MSLNQAQRQSYDDDGFVIIPKVFSEQECDDINDEIDRLIADDARAQGLDAHPRMWLMQLGLRSDITKRIASEKRLLDLVEEIVNPGIAIYSAKLVPKAPHNEEVCHWHQDDMYYQDNSISPVRMSIWLALQDSFEDNGAVHFVPGSHKQGLHPWHEAEDNHCRRTLTHPEQSMLDQAICPSVAKGSVVLFSSFVWHYSGPNKTDQLRRSFIVSYQDAITQGGNGDQWKILRPAPLSAHL